MLADVLLVADELVTGVTATVVLVAGLGGAGGLRSAGSAVARCGTPIVVTAADDGTAVVGASCAWVGLDLSAVMPLSPKVTPNTATTIAKNANPRVQLDATRAVPV